MKPRLGEAIAIQLASAAVMGFALNGRLAALMTATATSLALDGRPTLEISVAGRRGLCGPHLLGLCRLARLTLDAWSHHGDVALCGVVRAGYRPGQRLARLTGFTFSRLERGLELWVRHVGDREAYHG